MISAADRASLRWSAESLTGSQILTLRRPSSPRATTEEKHERSPSNASVSSAPGSWARGSPRSPPRPAPTSPSATSTKPPSRRAARASRPRCRGRCGRASSTTTRRPPRSARVRFVTDIGELADRQLVVEAVREFEDEKLEVFRSLGKIVDRRRRDPGVEHVVDPDHEAGDGHRAPRARGRPALLQPGAGDAPRGAHPVDRHQLRGGRPRRGLHGRRSAASGSSARRTAPASS